VRGYIPARLGAGNNSTIANQMAIIIDVALGRLHIIHAIMEGIKVAVAAGN
jgi:hypothetical protein